MNIKRFYYAAQIAYEDGTFDANVLECAEWNNLLAQLRPYGDRVKLVQPCPSKREALRIVRDWIESFRAQHIWFYDLREAEEDGHLFGEEVNRYVP